MKYNLPSNDCAYHIIYIPPNELVSIHLFAARALSTKMSHQTRRRIFRVTVHNDSNTAGTCAASIKGSYRPIILCNIVP